MCSLGSTYSTVLTLSFCTDDEFTCDDGTCIQIYLRCDGTNHCENSSDEKDCRMIVPKVGYNKNIVPPPIIEGKSLLFTL